MLLHPVKPTVSKQSNTQRKVISESNKINFLWFQCKYVFYLIHVCSGKDGKMNEGVTNPTSKANRVYCYINNKQESKREIRTINLSILNDIGNKSVTLTRVFDS